MTLKEVFDYKVTYAYVWTQRYGAQHLYNPTPVQIAEIDPDLLDIVGVLVERGRWKWNTPPMVSKKFGALVHVELAFVPKAPSNRGLFSWMK